MATPQKRGRTALHARANVGVIFVCSSLSRWRILPDRRRISARKNALTHAKHFVRMPKLAFDGEGVAQDRSLEGCQRRS